MRVSPNTDGFTLIEVLIGMVILTIITLGLTGLTVGTIQGQVVSRQLTVATTLAQDQLERVKQLGYLQAESMAGTEGYGTIANFPAFKRVTTVAANTPAAAIKTLTVSVSWASDARALTTHTTLAE